MPPGRNRPDRPLVEPRKGLCQSRYVVSADVLMQTFVDVCCQELLYDAACIAVPRPNRNFGINRYFTENYLPCLIDTSCCNFAESVLHVAKNSCTTVPHLVRSWMPPLCGLHFAALGLCCTWYEHAPTCVLVIFAALSVRTFSHKGIRGLVIL